MYICIASRLHTYIIIYIYITWSRVEPHCNVWPFDAFKILDTDTASGYLTWGWAVQCVYRVRDVKHWISEIKRNPMIIKYFYYYSTYHE
jgi:hypothetical protein